MEVRSLSPSVHTPDFEIMILIFRCEFQFHNLTQLYEKGQVLVFSRILSKPAETVFTNWIVTL